jgi:hypothetical protein
VREKINDCVHIRKLLQREFFLCYNRAPFNEDEDLDVFLFPWRIRCAASRCPSAAGIQEEK